MDLLTKPNIADPDGFYQELIDSQRDMTEEAAELMNCKLVLILANHVGDRGVLREAISRARGSSTED
ncbi:DUF2783 domain-containing protein [Bradyrhizobium mercantei]|uniref:DUF2783 domain-containing protein n=1 Tax=Bradyrhizobium mercantei TaxID=1904807 RepID=UPI000976A20E|nr:DUF2783 domain-containing protein [Bradyrhizobium mercantei]